MKKRSMTATETLAEQDMLDRAAREIAYEIDSNMALDMMLGMGYTEIALPGPLSDVDVFFMRKWLQENLTGHYMVHRNRWVFEHAEDATLFVLKWR